MKNKSFFNSFWFNVVMSIVAVVVLGDMLISNYGSGDYFHGFIMVIVWVVILYHFVRAAIKSRKN